MFEFECIPSDFNHFARAQKVKDFSVNGPLEDAGEGKAVCVELGAVMLCAGIDIVVMINVIGFEIDDCQTVRGIEAAVRHALQEDKVVLRGGGGVFLCADQQGKPVLPQDLFSLTDFVGQGGI